MSAEPSPQLQSLMGIAAEIRALLAGATGALSSSDVGVPEFAGPLIDLARERAEALHNGLDFLALRMATEVHHG